MPRPKNRFDLLNQSRERYDDLLKLVEGLPPAKREQQFLPKTMNRNVGDVLMHLHHWHLLFFDWYELGMDGQKPHMPAKGYTWRTVPELNRSIQKLHKDKTLAQARSALQISHERIMDLMSSHDNDDLFTKRRFAWTGSTSLGAYCISATLSHYDWAIKLIKKNLK